MNSFILKISGALVFSLVTLASFNAGAQSSNAVNIALAAAPSASYCSGDTTVDALNDGFSPRNSRDASHRSYGNWPSVKTEWVQYDWTQPVATKQIDVYWWADGQGVGAPKACRVLYWNGSDFVPVKNPTGLGIERNHFNTTTFDEVRTSKLRLEIDSDGRLSTGILEWKVYDSGNSPTFPPKVAAGVNRDVILTGKTYLSGSAKSLKNDTLAIKWEKTYGPGDVTFADAGALETTALFSQPGDYGLKLNRSRRLP